MPGEEPGQPATWIGWSHEATLGQCVAAVERLSTGQLDVVAGVLDGAGAEEVEPFEPPAREDVDDASDFVVVVVVVVPLESAEPDDPESGELVDAADFLPESRESFR